MTAVAAHLARMRRRIAVFVAPLIMSVAGAAPAWAATGATAAMLWIGVADSSHVPLGAYGLSLNNGSLTDPTAAPPAQIMHWFYSGYLCVIAIPIWQVQNVMSFKWLLVISRPLDYVGHQMTAMVHSPAVLTVIGLLAASAIAITFALGKVSRAAAQITVAILLACISVTLANKPISDLLGPNGGLAIGRDIGIGISSELSGKSLEGQQAVDALSASLVDHFARTPTLIWNFGQDLDAPPYNCGQAWSDAITTGPIDQVKDAVARNCPDGQALHDYAMSDPTSRRIVAFVAIVFAVVVLVLFTYLCAQVVILGLSTVFWLIVVIVALITGWIPGGSQNLALKAALDALFSFLGMIGMVALAGLAANLAGAMFAAAGGDLVVAMPLVTLLLAAVFVALWKVRKGLVNARERAVGVIRQFTADQPQAATGPANPLEHLDPLTAIPTAANRATALTRQGAATAAKAAIAAAAPEAAPLLGASDHLASRLHIRSLRSAKAAKTSAPQPNITPAPTTAPPTLVAAPPPTAPPASPPRAPRGAPAGPGAAPTTPPLVGQPQAASTGYRATPAPAPLTTTVSTQPLSTPPQPHNAPAPSVLAPADPPHRNHHPVTPGANTSPPQPIHPAITALAHALQEVPVLDDPDDMRRAGLNLYADVRAELMAQR